MKIIDTGDWKVTVELGPEACFRLSQACDIAGQQADEKNRADLALLWGSWSALFEGLAMAAAGRFYMDGKDRDEFTLQQLKQDRLEALGDPPLPRRERVYKDGPLSRAEPLDLDDLRDGYGDAPEGR